MNPVSATQTVNLMSQVGQLTEVSRNAPAGSTIATQPSGTSGFADLIQDYVRQTNNDQLVSDSAIHDFATGKTENVQQVVLAMANADMSFQLFMEIRNKLIDSYNELMRMQF